MREQNSFWSDDTEILHDKRHSKGAIAPPIYQTSTFSFNNYQAMLDRFRGISDQPIYSRVDNPTVSVLLDKICRLERGEASAAFASGIAAISNAILGQVKSGDRIVCVQHVYPDTYRLLKGICQRFGIGCEFVDGRDLDAIAKKLPGAKLLYLESPNSWMMQEQDLTAIAKLAKAEGVTSIVDNSWASPLFQKPLLAGINLVVHSASKYISGHSDTVAGLMVGSKAIVDKITRDTSPYLGAKLSAHEAGLLLRGLRTLPLRMQRHQTSSICIAEQLAAHKSVSQVYHPGLLRKDFSLLKGYGGLFSIELNKELSVPAFCDSLSLFRLGVSWGGYESLVMPAAASISQAGTHNAAVDFGISPQMIRLFVGLEDPDELWHDLEEALDNA